MATLTNPELQDYANKVLIKNNITTKVVVKDTHDPKYRNTLCLEFYSREVQVGLEVRSFLTDMELLAILCHELGHLQHEYEIELYGPHHCEFEADRLAIKYGASPEDLISGLKKAILRQGHTLDTEVRTHPSHQKRADNIRKWAYFYSI